MAKRYFFELRPEANLQTVPLQEKGRMLRKTILSGLIQVVSGYWWKKQKASSSSEFSQRLALAGRRVKEDDAYGKG